MDILSRIISIDVSPYSKRALDAPAMKSAESAFKFDCNEATKKKVLKTVTGTFQKTKLIR